MLYKPDQTASYLQFDLDPHNVRKSLLVDQYSAALYLLQIPPGTDSNYENLLKYLCEGSTKEIHHVTGTSYVRLDKNVVKISNNQLSTF